MGYVKGKSLISLVFGLTLGGPLFLSHFFSQKLSLLICFVSAGFFLVRYSETGALFPAGYGLLASTTVGVLQCLVLPRRNALKVE